MKLTFIKSWTVVLTLLVLTFGATGITHAHAATFMVTNLNNSGAGSLRQAIMDANDAAGTDTITFSVSGTIELLSTLPNITDASGLRINGTGQAVTISGNGAVRVVWVDAGAALTLYNLTIANGGNASDGGGIFSNGTLTITNSTFSSNSAGAGHGGGIDNTNGTLIITNSTFSNNSAPDGLGGGIENYAGTVTITNSTFSGNSAKNGGGVNNYNGGTLIITNSTFSGNSAVTDQGGGIDNSSGTVTLRNTIVANSPSGGNCSGVITNDGNNLDSGTTCGWNSASGSMSSTNPLLGSLTGSPAYLPLHIGSPAINTGNDAVCAAAPVNNTSQNGVARPQGPHCDIGSVEFQTTFPLFLPLIMR